MRNGGCDIPPGLAWLGVLASAFVVLGCAGPASPTSAPDPTVAASDTFRAAGCNRNRKVCFVNVKVTGTAPSYTVTLDPPDVLVSRSELNKEYLILWKLPRDFRFRPVMADGVSLKDPDQDEFYGNYSTDSEDGDPPTAKTQHRIYRMKFINSRDGSYRYQIRFHEKNGSTPILFDPVISNRGAG